LLNCIRSLVDGQRRPDEIVVVGHEHDIPTREALHQAKQLCAGLTALSAAWVSEPGHIPPVRKGLERASGEIIAFVDDDVTVTPHWLDYLVAPLDDPSVGVVGGRVVVPAAQPVRLKGKPGCLSWYGRHWGNVTSVEGDSPLEVGGVMECNWAWRCNVLGSLRFDAITNFDDASMYGLDLCLQAKRRHFRIVYEPRAIVYHHVAPRVTNLDRADRPRRTFAYARNYTYIMLKHLPRWRRPIFLAWWFLIGERGSWGLGALLAEMLAGRSPKPSHVWGALKGKVEGILLSCLGSRAHGS